MKTTLNFLVTIFLVSFLFLSSCKDDCPKCDDPTNPECENYDPCWGKDTINTFFKVRPGDRGFRPPKDWCKLVPCDTFNASSVRFDIPDGSLENSTFEWQIGTEAEPRTGKAFEVDFSDYLDENGWEQWIPVTLTVRTPMNECLVDPGDTLVTITRDLFFTNTLNFNIPTGQKSVKYRGHLVEEPNNEILIEFLKLDEWPSKNIDFEVDLVVGLPGVDTFLFPIGCPAEGCSNYNHIIARYNDTRQCITPKGVNLSELSNNLAEYQRNLLEGLIEVEYKWTFDNPQGSQIFTFRGIRN